MGYLDRMLGINPEPELVRPASNYQVPTGYGRGSIIPSQQQGTPIAPYAARDPQLQGFNAGGSGGLVQGPANPTVPGSTIGNPYGTAVSQDTVMRDLVTRDQQMGERALRQAGIETGGAQYGSLMADLQAQMEYYQQQRDSAIRAAGRGAAAPYSAAIARIGSEIEKAQAQLGRMGPLFDNKREINRIAYDNAQTELAVSADEALAEQSLISTKTYNNMRASFSDAQAATADVINKIGGDENTRIAAAQEVGRMEDEIMEMETVSAAGAQKILQASEDLAVALARATGANNNLDLVRNQIEIEADFKDRINTLIEDRKQQIAARNAAVSAAREMAAARIPESLPMNSSGFGSAATRNLLDKMMGTAPAAVRGEVEGLLGLFSGLGVRTSETTKLLRGAAAIAGGKDADVATYALAGKYGIDLEQIATLPTSVFSWGQRVIPTALDTYNNGVAYYDKNIATGKPSDFAPGSAGQVMNVYTNLIGMGMTEDDATHQARQYAQDAETGKDMTQIDRFFNRGGM